MEKPTECTKGHDSSTDVATLQAQIKKLRAHIFQLNSVIDCIPASIYWKDSQGRYLGCNEYALDAMRQFGFVNNDLLEKIIGKTDFELFESQTAQSWRDNDLQVMREEKSQSVEETFQHPNTGETITQLSTKTPLLDEQGNVAGVLGNTIDITYLKKIEQDLRVALDKAEQASRMKIKFLRNMEHDIRTPFNGILGLSEYLLQIETDEHKKNCLSDIRDSTQELLKYCNNILDFSRTEQQNEPIKLEQIMLTDLVDSIVTMQRPALKTGQLDFKLEFLSEIPAVLVGDCYRIERILINLISNAIKFTKQGGITLGLRAHHAQKSKTINVDFVITDTGIGIDPEIQQQLYEMFERATPSNQNTFKGLGLGLYVVKQFVDDLQGTLSMQSSFEGTCFCVTIPFLRD